MPTLRAVLPTITSTLLAMTLFTTSTANATRFESTEKQTSLLELYTSEGCSSCPPADRWLSTLKQEDGLWQTFIPLAFHVDYWDYIGWEDRFASPAHTARQRIHAQEQSMRTIYTPGFMYNGKEWRQWFVRRYLDFPETGTVGKLTVDINQQTASVTFNPAAAGGVHLDVNIALLGFDLETQVKAGENVCDVLKHDFVVLGSARNARTPRWGEYTVMIQLPERSNDAPKYGVVVWVSPAGSQRPLQAVGGWLE